MSSHGEEPLEDLGRLGMQMGMAGSRLAETAIRNRQDRARVDAARSEQHAQELTARYAAEAEVAERYLAAAVKDEAWVARTDRDEIVGAWRTAAEWRLQEPERFTRYAETLEHRIHNRYGLDLAKVAEAHGGDLGRAEGVALQHLAAHTTARAQADRERNAELDAEGQAARSAGEEEAAEHRNDAEAHATAAAELEQESETEGLAYDSAQRREQTAAELEDAGVPQDQVHAKVTADKQNAQHPREAGRAAKRAGGRASRTGVSGPRKQRDKGGLSR